MLIGRSSLVSAPGKSGTRQAATVRRVSNDLPVP
jgi:hypothetical protein